MLSFLKCIAAKRDCRTIAHAKLAAAGLLDVLTSSVLVFRNDGCAELGFSLP